MTIAAPCDYNELEQLLEYAVFSHNGPIAVRYPRGSGPRLLAAAKPVRRGKGVKLLQGEDITIAAVGNMVETALKEAEILKKSDISAEVINARFVKPLDERLILMSAEKTGAIVTIEDNCVRGGFGSAVLELLNRKELTVKSEAIGFQDIPVTHGSREDIYKKHNLDAVSVARKVTEILKRM
jgi:1-deoxy-D-xylulose-5-phosphate synthase